jgi:hypothetical protein
MRKTVNYHLAVTILFLAALLINGCGSDTGADTPKEAVIGLFGAMDKDDRGAVFHLLDMSALMGKETEDYALQSDEPRIFHNPEEILDDLTGDGLTKKRWFAMQRVIGHTELFGDSATVEVSFIDKSTETQYFTKFGVRVVNGRWKIYSFRKVD